MERFPRVELYWGVDGKHVFQDESFLSSIHTISAHAESEREVVLSIINGPDIAPVNLALSGLPNDDGSTPDQRIHKFKVLNAQRVHMFFITNLGKSA